MIRRPPRSTRTDTLFPYTTLFRSKRKIAQQLFDVGGIGPLSEKTPAEVYRCNHFFVHLGGHFLRHQANSGPRSLILADNVVPPHQYLPGAGGDQSANDVDQRRLARAICAQQGKNRTLTNLQVDIVERLRPDERRVGKECVSTYIYRG